MGEHHRGAKKWAFSRLPYVYMWDSIGGAGVNNAPSKQQHGRNIKKGKAELVVTLCFICRNRDNSCFVLISSLL